MTTTFPDSVKSPDFKSSVQTKAAVLQNDFGDGYTQRAADGMNNLRDTWNVSWTNLPSADKDTIVSFLRARGGWDSFFWTAPGASSPGLWTCQGWTVQPNFTDIWTVTAQFRQEFDPVS